MDENKKYESVAAQRARMQGESQNADALNPEIKGEKELSAKERREIEKEKLKDMPWTKKAEYIWMYYKYVFIWTVVIIAAICIGLDMYDNSKIETVLSVSIVNAGNYDSEAMTEELREIVGAEGKYEYVSLTSNFGTTAEGTELEYNSQMAYVTHLSAGDMDVMIMPESLYENELKRTPEAFCDMKKLLGEEVYQAFGDNIDQYHIALTGDETMEKLGAYYEPACIVVFSNAKNTERIVKWITSLAD